MIVYHNSSVDKSAESYNSKYAADPEHFSHRATFAAIEHYFATVPAFSPRSCIDIGCGQGQVLSFIVDLISRGGDAVDRSKMLGVDKSVVAIQQCDIKWPKNAWVADDYVSYLRSQDFGERFPDGVDLIVNKGGFTHVYGEQDYVEAMESP